MANGKQGGNSGASTNGNGYNKMHGGVGKEAGTVGTPGKAHYQGKHIGGTGASKKRLG